jgi:hypothetical protein
MGPHKPVIFPIPPDELRKDLNSSLAAGLIAPLHSIQPTSRPFVQKLLSSGRGYVIGRFWSGSALKLSTWKAGTLKQIKFLAPIF